MKTLEEMNFLELSKVMDKIAQSSKERKVPRRKDRRLELLKSYIKEDAERAEVLSHICHHLHFLDLHVRGLEKKMLQIKGIIG